MQTVPFSADFIVFLTHLNLTTHIIPILSTGKDLFPISPTIPHLSRKTDILLPASEFRTQTTPFQLSMGTKSRAHHMLPPLYLQTDPTPWGKVIVLKKKVGGWGS